MSIKNRSPHAMRLALCVGLALPHASSGLLIAPTSARLALTPSPRHATVKLREPADDQPRDSLSLERAAMAKQAEELSKAVEGLGPADAARLLASRVTEGASVGKALEALERARQEAGGQTADDYAAAEAIGRGASASSVAMADELPDSFEDSISRSAAALADAVDAGVSRLVIEFDTSAGDETFTLLSRTMQFTQPLLPRMAAALQLEPAEGAEDGVPGIQLLFPDEGTAAMVRQKWELPRGTAVGSMGRVQLLQGATALVLVSPGATEVATVQRLLKAVDADAPATPVLMINPKLVDMQSTGYGLVGRELRTLVADTFEVVFCLKTLLGGALYRAFPRDWALWREDPGAPNGYAAAYSGPRRPGADEQDELLFPDDGDAGGSEGGASFMDGFAKFVKGFQAL